MKLVDAPAVVQRDALGLGFFDLEVVGGHLVAALEAGLVDRRGAEAARRARRVDGDVAAADDEHLLAGQVHGLAELDVGEEGERALDALELLAGNAQAHGLVRAVATRTASKPSSLSAATSSTRVSVWISTPMAVTLATSSSMTSFGSR